MNCAVQGNCKVNYIWIDSKEIQPINVFFRSCVHCDTKGYIKIKVSCFWNLLA